MGGNFHLDTVLFFLNELSHLILMQFSKVDIPILQIKRIRLRELSNFPKGRELSGRAEI